MAKARALDKRRKSIRNIRKITRTMELIATAKFKKAMDRATAATSFTRRLTQLVGDLARSGYQVDHPLLRGRSETKAATLLVLGSGLQRRPPARCSMSGTAWLLTWHACRLMWHKPPRCVGLQGAWGEATA